MKRVSEELQIVKVTNLELSKRIQELDIACNQVSGKKKSSNSDNQTLDRKKVLEKSKQSLNKQQKYHPTLGYSLKPFVLLFDEIYTDLYRISEAQQRMIRANKMVFMGTSFSVNITAIALRIAASNSIDIEIIDPNPIDIGYKHAAYFEMSALEYVESFL